VTNNFRLAGATPPAMHGEGRCREPRRLRIIHGGCLTAVVEISHVSFRCLVRRADRRMASRPHLRGPVQSPRCFEHKLVAGSKRNRDFKASGVA
jgi:hypothetical protein